jgi:putative ATP-binding cassette transporter
MSLLRLLLRSSWRTAALASLAGMASGVSMLGLIALIHAALGQGARPSALLAGAFAGLCLVALGCRVGSQAILVRLSQQTVSRMSRGLCRQVLDVPLKQLEELGPHRILVALTGDIVTVAQALNGIPALCVNLASLGCGLAYLGWLSPGVLAAALGFLIVGVASYRVTAARALPELKQARDDQDRLMKHLRSLILGIKELKLHRARREAFMTGPLLETDASLRAHMTRGLTLQTTAVTWGRLLFFVAIGLLVFVFPRVEPLDTRTLAGLTLTILYLTGPVEGIIGWLPVLGRAQLALAKVEELGLALDMAGCDNGEAAPVSAPGWRRLELVDATHAYRGERDDRGFLLGPIDLELHPGEIVFIVGGNGSGKTTLVKLVTGLYTPESGSVLLDGRAVAGAGKERERQRHRELFSAVFADVVLFDSLLGLEAPTLDATAREYLARLQLDHRVTIERGVFSTTELSRGQRKRLALLTAYLEDRPIYVFDEWAADQDPLFKELFYTRILPDLKARGKCVLAVTHDESYFPLADRIVRLRDGKLIDGASDYERQQWGESLAGPA